MQDVVVLAGTGAMYAIIGLDDEAIAKRVKMWRRVKWFSPVNFNSPGKW